jgi:hypothetical protein
MPLRDHFVPPLSVTHPWRGFLSIGRTASPASSTRGGLPEGYWAIPNVEFARVDTVEVHVFRDEGGPRLRAVVELVTPSNKDRPGERRAFAMKCASYLHQGVGVVVVDVVTARPADLHAELLRVLEFDNEAAWQSPSGLYAVAYRTTVAEGRAHLQVWTEALALGVPLPCLPLWLGDTLVVPLNLEASYVTTCASLRMQG